MSTSPKVVRAAGGRFIQMLGNQVLFKFIGQDTARQFTIIRPPGQGAGGGRVRPLRCRVCVTPLLDVAAFRAHPERYTIVDIRAPAEYLRGPLFEGALNIPLLELRERAHEIPTTKPVVIHCAGGYRSAAGSSLVAPGRARWCTTWARP